jgi:GH15 family glucan-1,4-alpha-glucosidase
MRALTPEDLEEPLRLIEHVARGALPSGALAEQIDPASGEPAGATPLTWAHGTAIQTILEYAAAKERLEPPGAPSSPELAR